MVGTQVNMDRASGRQGPVRMSIAREHCPPWDVRIAVRGVEIPTRHPFDAQDATVHVVMPDRDRWPGLLVWLWRMVFGAPRTPEQPPADIEKQATLRICKALTPEPYHGLLDTLSDGELLAMVQTYLGNSEVWAFQLKANAAAAQRKAMEEQKASAISHQPPVRGAEAEGDGDGASRLLRPGCCLPASMGGGAWGARLRQERHRSETCATREGSTA